MTLVKRNGSGEIAPSIWDNFLSRDLFHWDLNFGNPGSSLPSVNIKETPNKFQVEMAAPGLDKKDFKIELDGTALTISSERQEQSSNTEIENYNRREFCYEAFSRTFHLPKQVVNADQIKANYANGILILEIPKREEAKQKPARLISVQ